MPRIRAAGVVSQTVEVAVPRPGRPLSFAPVAAGRALAPTRLVRSIRSTRRTVALPRPTKPAPVVALLRRAIEWDRQLRSGAVASQAELVRSEGFTRSRVSQILGLLRLAPAVRRAILELPPAPGRPPVSEHALQPLLRIRDAQRQLRAFQRLIDPAVAEARAA